MINQAVTNKIKYYAVGVSNRDCYAFNDNQESIYVE